MYRTATRPSTEFEGRAPALRVCDALDLPVAPEKVDGPSSYILFLGIGIDTKAMELRLPHNKLARLLQSLKGWQTHRACTKRELLSLIGVLQHAVTIVRPGRCFLRHMIDSACRVAQLHHHIRLDRGFRSDVMWWLEFTKVWNGRSLPSPRFTSCRTRRALGGVGPAATSITGSKCSGLKSGDRFPSPPKS